MTKKKDDEKTIYINGVVSSQKDLLIWRLFYFLPIYLYIYVTFATFENDDISLLQVIGLMPIAALWILITHKVLLFFRRKVDYVKLTLTKSSLSIYDGRTFEVSLSDIEYIKWEYPPFTVGSGHKKTDGIV